MNKNLIKIAEVTLFILEKKSWSDLSLKEVKKKSKVKFFDNLIKNKQGILKILNNYFDYKLSNDAKNIEKSNHKDMIFEILMMRFDILQIYRKSVISIFNSFKKKPDELIFLLPDLLESVILMLNFAKIPTKGVVGSLKVKGIFIIYASTFFVWLKDENISLERTMTSLDNYLNNAGKILKFIN